MNHLKFLNRLSFKRGLIAASASLSLGYAKGLYAIDKSIETKDYLSLMKKLDSEPVQSDMSFLYTNNDHDHPRVFLTEEEPSNYYSPLMHAIFLDNKGAQNNYVFVHEYHHAINRKLFLFHSAQNVIIYFMAASLPLTIPIGFCAVLFTTNQIMYGHNLPNETCLEFAADKYASDHGYASDAIIYFKNRPINVGDTAHPLIPLRQSFFWHQHINKILNEKKAGELVDNDPDKN
jgi:hypothetical protein